MKANQPTRRQAFTLVEMLVVILIMSILVTLVTLGVTRAMRYASEVGTKTEMAQIEQALGVAAL
ncbi:MAG: type II secretion system protein, partial [Planctomycetes bacterium]|nr:type II secretion system protein [Planctomycetota bacterium]